jgi:hypothetical protein
MLSHIRYLNTLHIAQDANFRLNNRAHKLGYLDAPLQPGSAHMVDPAPLTEYVKKFIDEKEVSRTVRCQRLQWLC